MGSLRWYIDRLKAMNIPEVSWRISQKFSSETERFRFSSRIPVFEKTFWPDARSASFDHNRLGINFANKQSVRNTAIRLLGPYEYSDYATDWHAGFNTTNHWPVVPIASLRYKQRDDIGDARLNWELNRLHQLALLAKEYYISRDPETRSSLKRIFDDWADKNPFLHGIAWTSVMEVAIRAISLIYTLAFLCGAKCDDTSLTGRIRISILNSINYVVRHYSRYSSANNHLLVEMTAIGLAGYAFDVPRWRKLAVDTLTAQLPLQTYPDGVNREVSLHYHSFVMEAYLLMAHVMQSNGDLIPREWITMLDRMAQYLASSMISADNAIEFGDNDEGKIIDLQGGDNFSHYAAVLQMASLIIKRRYTSLAHPSENINWFFPQSDIDAAASLQPLDFSSSRTFADGGYSILRSLDNLTVVAIDHAAHGFGSIAAHAHDDALSFQLFHKGKPILGDPGTAVYHCNLPLRNRLRDARHHSTVTVNGFGNAEILGAFLWGRKPSTQLFVSELTRDVDTIIADSTGLSGITLRRKFTFDKISSTLIIDDQFQRECDWTATFVAAPGVDIVIDGKNAILADTFMLSTDNGNLTVSTGEYSERFGSVTDCKILSVTGHGCNNTFIINLIQQD